MEGGDVSRLSFWILITRQRIFLLRWERLKMIADLVNVFEYMVRLAALEFRKHPYIVPSLQGSKFIGYLLECAPVLEAELVTARVGPNWPPDWPSDKDAVTYALEQVTSWSAAGLMKYMDHLYRLEAPNVVHKETRALFQAESKQVLLDPQARAAKFVYWELNALGNWEVRPGLEVQH
jgi:hypothetical protein